MSKSFSIPRAVLAMALAAMSVFAFQLPASAESGLPPIEQYKPLAEGEGVNANPKADQKINSPLAPTLYYRMIPGTAFKTRGSDQGYTYTGQGCIGRTQVDNSPDIYNSFFSYFLDLPDGATLKYVRTYNYSSAAGLYGASYVTKFDAKGGYATSLSYSSVSKAGYNDVLSEEITETLDTYSYAYNLEFYVNTTSYSLCGMRVAYYLPVTYAAYLPVVMR